MCHASFQESFVGSECCPSLDRVHIGVPVLWSSATTLFPCRIVVMIEAPLCSLNNVHIVQPHRVCHLASQLDVISNYVPLVSIKWLFSVPRCCVLPEDKVSGLAMHGKPVALSRGATMLGISSCLLLALCFTEIQYQTESKRDKNGQRFFWNIYDFWEVK